VPAARTSASLAGLAARAARPCRPAGPVPFALSGRPLPPCSPRAFLVSPYYARRRPTRSSLCDRPGARCGRLRICRWLAGSAARVASGARLPRVPRRDGQARGAYVSPATSATTTEPHDWRMLIPRTSTPRSGGDRGHVRADRPVSYYPKLLAMLVSGDQGSRRPSTSTTSSSSHLPRQRRRISPFRLEPVSLTKSADDEDKKTSCLNSSARSPADERPSYRHSLKETSTR
jgi:hypothetical protein